MDFWSKAIDVYTTTGDYFGVASLTVTILIVVVKWFKSGRKKKKSQHILNKLCQCRKNDCVKIVIPYHELSPSLYGTRHYVLANEMDEIQRLYQLFWKVYGFQKIALPSSNMESNLNIYIGGPAVSPEVSMCFYNHIPSFRCIFYGKRKQYESTQNDDHFFECDDTVMSDGKVHEGFYFKSQTQPFKKELSVSLINGKQKHFHTDYALFVRIRESNVETKQSNIIMFGQSSCGTQAAVDFFINHYDVFNKLVEQNGHKNENFMFCFDVIPNNIGSGAIDQKSLVDLSQYIDF